MKNMIYTQSDFARRIGRSKQWVSDKVKRHVSMNGYEGTMHFNSVLGEVIKVRLIRNDSSFKWLLCVLN